MISISNKERGKLIIVFCKLKKKKKKLHTHIPLDDTQMLKSFCIKETWCFFWEPWLYYRCGLILIGLSRTVVSISLGTVLRTGCHQVPFPLSALTLVSSLFSLICWIFLPFPFLSFFSLSLLAIFFKNCDFWKFQFSITNIGNFLLKKSPNFYTWFFSHGFFFFFPIYFVI
jgi:hypothetical protein